MEDFDIPTTTVASPFDTLSSELLRALEGAVKTEDVDIVDFLNTCLVKSIEIYSGTFLGTRTAEYILEGLDQLRANGCEDINIPPFISTIETEASFIEDETGHSTVPGDGAEAVLECIGGELGGLAIFLVYNNDGPYYNRLYKVEDELYSILLELVTLAHSKK